MREQLLGLNKQVKRIERGQYRTSELNKTPW
jgi:hypothetical protein